AFGRMIEKRSGSNKVQRFAYDAEHQLIEVRTEHGGRTSVVKMTYDPLGRRIAKSEHDDQNFPLGETRFTWDGMRLLQEHRHSQTSLYVYADDGYDPLARVDGSGALQKIRYYHNDLNGLPEQLTETDGHIVWQARYRVWGNTVEEIREPYYLEEQNLRFQGQYLDRETGLHYNTFRFYDPDIGRFTTPDPIGLAGGINLYQYAPNPVGWVGGSIWIKCRILEDKGIATGRRVKGNPSIALTPKHHDDVHGEENRLRAKMGTGPNQMLKRGKLEIRLMSQAIHNSLVKTGVITQQQLRTARRSASVFAKRKGCF
ncbi:RHS repeat-associated core domain-containing protein, partial [Pseudomonas alliivorans]|nr:RHS repeat-associated core domain-containing protein [Pseudomonas alliivorans]MEE5020816.1 RHS repeat-associated core domain-containing protein [Pseudomonas alliivorans]